MKKMFESTLARYVLVGGGSFALELCSLLFLSRVLDIPRTGAVAASFWVGLLASFILQKTFAFKDYRRERKLIFGQLTQYSILVVFNYIFTLAVVGIFPESLLVASRTLALAITTTWNYMFYKKFLFSRRKQPSTQPLHQRVRYLIRQIIENPRMIMWVLLILLPIILFFWQYLFTGNKTIMGDFDYYSQQYEAARISILEYHQFPLWNPWLSGGIPLISNPQFGLFAPPMAFVLVFGTLYGMKLAYVFYALAGFLGMYRLSKDALGADRTRSLLVSYIWIFGGFFAGHTIAHFTFISFFLLPWLVYFIAQRTKLRYAWFGLGVVESVVILTSIHYAFLMMTLALAVYFMLQLLSISVKKGTASLSVSIDRATSLFIAKTLAVIVVLAGWQFIFTYVYVSHNQRINVIPEIAPSLGVIFQALFMPIGTLLDYPKTTWGWGEYSMQIGIGVLLALLVCVASVPKMLFAHRKRKRATKEYPLANIRLVLTMLTVGVIGLSLALGNFASWSPFNMLLQLPGFEQTRVPSRWVIFLAFSLLVLLASWQHHKRLINILLLISVLELFLTNGPPRIHGQPWVSLPAADYNSSITQYDNGFIHYDGREKVPANEMPWHYYYYTTTQNIGQIYADDSLINTLSSTPLLLSSRCAQNTDKTCTFVRTHNADVAYWSPNKIILQRTGPGLIELNMNVSAGWRINGKYPFAHDLKLDPGQHFLLQDDGEKLYTLQYAPKLSPNWLTWKIDSVL